jgi:putative membrane protein insertion efficiency factor
MTGLRRIAWAAGWPLRAALVGAIRVYRITLSGMLGGQCRFHPTCSAYAEEVVAELGAVRGVALSTWRVLRCSPLTAGGVDFPPGHERRHRRGVEVTAP